MCVVASLQAGYASSIGHPRDCERMDATVSEQFVDHYGSVQDVPPMRKEKCVQGKKKCKKQRGRKVGKEGTRGRGEGCTSEAG